MLVLQRTSGAIGTTGAPANATMYEPAHGVLLSRDVRITNGVTGNTRSPTSAASCGSACDAQRRADRAQYTTVATTLMASVTDAAR